MPLAHEKPPPSILERESKRKAKAAQLRAVRIAVKKRDQGRCRACSKKGVHLHHLRFRSQGGQHATSNCLLLCDRCHADIHGYRLTIRGDDADKTLRFVRRL